MAIYVRDEKGVLQALDIPAYKGEKGEAGITPNLQIGDVTTLESGQQATITRRGDDENPIFDFAIPKGENGEDGIFVGRIEDAPSHAQIVVNDDASPYDLFFENANVSYMGDTYTSLKEKADADIEYLLRKFGTQHYEGSSITATNTYMKRVNSAMFKGVTKYRDKITGEILEAFEEGRNLELVSVKMPVLTTYNTSNLWCVSELLDETEVIGGHTLNISKFILVEPGETIYFNQNIAAYAYARFYSEDEIQISEIQVAGYSRELGFYDKSHHIVPKNARFMRVLVRKNLIGSMMVNRGNDYLPYEEGKPYKSNILSIDGEYGSVGDVHDTVDLITGEAVQRTELREYQEGDETNSEVTTDMKNTRYKLATPLIKTVDLNGQKVYSYDGTTHYITSSLQGHPNPILSIDVPTNTTKMIARQREEIEHQEQKLQEQEEVQNLLIETQLAWFEDNISTLELTDEETPSHIQKLYELTRKYRVEEE